ETSNFFGSANFWSIILTRGGVFGLWNWCMWKAKPVQIITSGSTPEASVENEWADL
ncbi:Hypothetical protein FKW44_007265, partial [Caligus rogercresseyi]